MSASVVRVLIVDDDLAIGDRVRSLLAEFDGQFLVDCRGSYDEGLAAVDEGLFDVLLVNPRLGDGDGLDLIRQAFERGLDKPAILFCEGHDQDVDLQAIRAGALGFLDKNRLDGDSLVRAIRYAVETERQRTQRRREALIGALERCVEARPSPVTEEAFRLGTLRQTAPARFFELVRQYDRLLDLALEQRSYKVDHDLAERLRTFADGLGSLGAGPRDVIEIHCSALKEKGQHATPEKVSAYVQEGMVLALEIMGHLAGYYRNLCFGMRGEPAVMSAATLEKAAEGRRA